MKYFEKAAGAETDAMRRTAAAIAKKRKKIKTVIDAPVKVIPQDKKAIAIAESQESIARSRAMLAQKSVKFDRSL